MWQKLNSRRFWLACAGVLFVIITEVIGASIPAEAYWALTGSIIAYVLGESYADANR